MNAHHWRRRERSVLPLSPMKFAGTASVVLLAMTADCVSEPFTAVRVRDARAVSVEIETLHGPEALLSAGGANEEVDLPRTSPPYASSALFEASAIRDETGGIALRCDACLAAPAMHLLSGNGVALFRGSPANQVDWHDGKLRVHVTYPYYVPSGFHGRLTGPYTAFEANLITPTENVADVRQVRTVNRGGAVAVLVLGAMFTTVGAFLLSTPTSDGGTRGDGRRALGELTLGLGVMLDLGSLVTLLIRSEGEPVRPSDASP